MNKNCNEQFIKLLTSKKEEIQAHLSGEEKISDNSLQQLLEAALSLLEFCNANEKPPSGPSHKQNSKAAMNQISSSEKSASRVCLTPEERIKRHQRLAKFHSTSARNIKKSQQRRRNKEKIMNKKEEFEEISATLTPEEEAESDKETEELMEKIVNGLKESDGTEKQFENSRTELFNSPNLAVNNSSVAIPAEEDPVLRKHFRSAKEHRKRIDVSISITELDVEVETLTNPQTGEVKRASTQDLGPQGTRITWNTFTNVILLIVGYAFPMHRLERLLGGTLRRSHFIRYLDRLAWALLPIYKHIFGILANAEILATDDTPIRVNEHTQWKHSPGYNNNSEPPWDNSTTQEEFPKTLFHELKDVLPFDYPLRNNAESVKKSLNLTVLTGKAEEKVPGSRLVAYKSHRGNAGDLISELLLERKKSNKELVIQSDLSSNNLPTANKAHEKFHIKYAGCLSHARRDFKRYEAQEPELAGHILSAFALIASAESLLDDAGRNRRNVLTVRKVGEKHHWQEIFELCELLQEKWSKQTPLGSACNYVIKNFKKLTYYLTDPRVAATNNLCERLLRLEALDDSSSFGRDSIEGRIRFDIIRSFLATCSFAKADVRSYFVFIMLADKEHVATHPALYLPLQFTRYLTKKSDELASSEKYTQDIALRAAVIMKNSYTPFVKDKF